MECSSTTQEINPNPPTLLERLRGPRDPIADEQARRDAARHIALLEAVTDERRRGVAHWTARAWLVSLERSTLAMKRMVAGGETAETQREARRVARELAAVRRLRNLERRRLADPAARAQAVFNSAQSCRGHQTRRERASSPRPAAKATASAGSDDGPAPAPRRPIVEILRERAGKAVTK